ncbi:hypothetical protein V7S43_014618 [Phytophthora oleae]|uniref:Uncharacterized protein n=1 Tax=Phytophthora oleae TaxID=2107226 RepID=A0ABD3F378_9STRA
MAKRKADDILPDIRKHRRLTRATGAGGNAPDEIGRAGGVVEFQLLWQRLRKEGWTSKPPLGGRSVDPRHRYIRPGGNPRGVPGEDYLLGEEAVLAFYFSQGVIYEIQYVLNRHLRVAPVKDVDLYVLVVEGGGAVAYNEHCYKMNSNVMVSVAVFVVGAEVRGTAVEVVVPVEVVVEMDAVKAVVVDVVVMVIVEDAVEDVLVMVVVVEMDTGTALNNRWSLHQNTSVD